MKQWGAAGVISGLSLALALAASLWLAVWPYSYRGVRATEVPSPQGGGAPVYTEVNASFLEMNGAWGAFVLTVPVVLSLVAFAVARTYAGRTKGGIIALWVLGALFLALCFLAVFSIGMFYAPAALTLLAAAFVATFLRPRRVAAS